VATVSATSSPLFSSRNPTLLQVGARPADRLSMLQVLTLGFVFAVAVGSPRVANQARLLLHAPIPDRHAKALCLAIATRDLRCRQVIALFLRKRTKRMITTSSAPHRIGFAIKDPSE